MNKKTGTAGSPVAPIQPKAPEEADVADPGQVSEIKAEQRQLQTGKYGSIKVKQFQPPASNETSPEDSPEDAAAQRTWIEIELIGEDDKPIPGERYELILSDGETVASGTLDQNGLARVDGIEPGTCKVCFPELDKDAWEDA